MTVTAPRPLCAYLTHPLGERRNGSKRQDNIASALAWVRFLFLATPWSISVPWLAYVLAIDDELHRPRVLVDQRRLVEIHDVLVMTGGAVSTHMRMDDDHAQRRKIPVVDLTPLGSLPPPLTGADAWRLISPFVDRAFRMYNAPDETPP